jgi:two-component system, NarL family, response regulator NreC
VKEDGTSDLFTTREREILELLGQGKTSKEIAGLLNLRVTTIASHRKNICRKLGAHSTAELIFLSCSRPGVHSVYDPYNK